MDGNLQTLKQQVCSYIDKAKDKLRRLGDTIWQHPELAYEERQAHDALVCFFTEEEGWNVEAHFKLQTSFRATWGTVGATEGESVVNVGFLCEYDALPAIGHACGHNLIAEMQQRCVSRPCWRAWRSGLFVSRVTVKYLGRASHASAYPWEGVNALDAAVMAYDNISVLRQQLRTDWRVHGIIKHGGVKPNIIPDYTELEYYLRTPSHRELPIIKGKAEACFRAAAMATGCEVDLLYAKNELYEILRNRTLEDLYDDNGKALGMKLVTVDSPGSTDFGNVTHAVPGIHPYFYIGSEALNHTAEYTAASGAEEARFYTLRAAKALAMTALDVIFSPGVLDRVKQEFTEAKLREERGLK